VANPINDLDLKNWKESCQEIWTDSLWQIDKRDASGAHKNGSAYHGNFVPQIPRQLIQRYTKPGDVVIDPFLGGGTTLIEARRQGRHGIGIELNPEVVAQAAQNIGCEPRPSEIYTAIREGDARSFDLSETMQKAGWTSAQLVIMHPPYHDIIKFSEDDPSDLSQATDVSAFLQMFGECVDNICQWLEKGRYLAVVCGDKYAKGEWIPLGFQTMQECLKRSFLLKSIVVKNMAGNEVGKGVNNGLWRYRALAGGFYVFKHEYLFLLQKTA
jgi:tRNA G10  N-methylase Trm11